MKKILKKMDKPLLIISFIYTVLGTIMILSASSISAVLRYYTNPYHFFIKQVIFAFLAFAFGFFVILRVNTKEYPKLSKLLLLCLIIVLALMPFIGTYANGARSWLKVGPISIQPSEFAKSILIIYLGAFFGNYRKNYKGKYTFLIPLSLSVLVFILVAIEPDLGTALIIGGIVYGIYMFVPFKKKSEASKLKLISTVGIFLLVIVVLFSGKLLTEEQKSRITYKAPCTRYTAKTGYQTCNGFIAINGGGLFGKGLGNSVQKYLYLPDSHTDFIFPIVVEELGVVTGLLLIAGYVFIIFRIMKISQECYKLQNSIICIGVVIYITMHLLINFGGILALIPLTGVPVPFLSYGGTFLINLISLIFVVERISIENKETKRKLEISRI